MKNMLKIGIVLIILTNLSSSIRAQEEMPAPEMPREQMILMQIDGMMMGEIDMIMQLYHNDVQLYKFPATPLAVGKEKAREFWVKKFENKIEKSIEMMDFYEIGDKNLVRIREVDPKAQTHILKVIIFEFKESKISALYFLEP